VQGSSVFVRKLIRSTSKDENRRSKELSCLEALRLLKHPNIVPLLYSFTQMQHFNFIFPCLEMDLGSFLQRPERFGKFAGDETFYQAIQGLASAVDAIHNFKIVGDVDMDLIISHHDLRPENILVTHDSFMLADFGLSRMKPPVKGSKTEWKNTRGDYIAPECWDEDFVPQTVGRPIDIWALGCLIIELATYMAEGTEGVREARENRLRPASNKWNIDNAVFSLGDSVRPEVMHHVEQLQATYGKNLPLTSLLEAAKALLVVKVEARPSSADVFKILSIVTTQSLWNDVKAAMSGYEESLTNSGHTIPFAFDVMYEKKKLHMWGLSLHLHKFQLARETIVDPGGIMDIKLLEKAQDFLRELSDMCKKALVESLETNEEQELLLFSSDHFTTILHEFRKRIVGLLDLLPIRTQSRASEMFKNMIINTLDFNDPSSMHNTPGMDSEQQQEQSSMAVLRNLKRSLLEIGDIDEEASRLCIEKHRLSGVTRLSGGNHEVANLTNHHTALKDHPTVRRVLVENVPYSEVWLKRSFKERAERIAAVAKLLSQRKPEELRVLDCVGYFLPNDDGYSLIFQFPNDSTSLIPETLLSQLRKAIPTKQSRPEKPALEERCRLALILARSILALHSVGWLHKALNSNNILFFTPPASFGSPDLSKPYLVDFRFSRPHDVHAYTDGPDDERQFATYVHPAYLRERRTRNEGGGSRTEQTDLEYSEGRFRKVYDYYSLGIILLEIGYWSLMENILSKHKTHTPEEITELLLDKYIPRLSSIMGGLYMKVVKDCVGGGIEESDGGAENIGSGRDFYSLVIDPLLSIHVG
jgi:serine/threonine protein kinase